MDNKKIGEYIHLHLENYHKRGIQRTEENANPENYNFMNYVQSRISSLNLKRYNTSDIEEKLNLLTIDEEELNEERRKIREELRRAVEKYLLDKYGETMSKIDWQRNTIDKTGKQIVSDSNVKLTKIKQTGKKGVKVNSLISRLEILNLEINALKKEGKIQKASELNEKVKKYYQELKQLSDINIKDLRDRGLDIGKVIKDSERLTNLITSINATVLEYASNSAVNIQKGDLFEYLVALAPALIFNNMSKSLNELKETVLGAERSNMQLELGAFSDEINWNEIAKDGYKVADGIFMTVLPTQEKIDVLLKWDNIDIPSSLKNVNLSSGYDVHIVSGTSFLMLIANENTDFVNHYLNVISNHTIDGINETHQRVVEAHNAMKIVILYKALSGDVGGRKPAEVFIVNDNKTGKIKVYNIVDLVEKGAKNLKLVSVTSGKTDLSQIKIDNSFDKNGGYPRRITNIISQVHNNKISAALKPAIFK